MLAAPPLARRVSRQSHRPDSEQATVSRPAEHRPGSGRWRRPQSERRHGSRLVVDGAFELLEATPQRLELALEAGDEFGFGGVGLVGWVKVCDHLLEAFEAGSHVAGQGGTVIGFHGRNLSGGTISG
jgi:hypothetical protein